MTYVMSDIHGFFEKYVEMLSKIHFNSSDSMFILGDVLDRGEHPIKVLLDMSMRENVFPILGNHEYMALRCFKKLMVEITLKNCEHHLDADDIAALTNWLGDGGQTTLNEFKKLPRDEQEYLVEYLEEFALYESLKVGGQQYLLVHSGLLNFSPERSFDDYEPYELLFNRADYDKRYFDDIILVTGHTPTFLIDKSCHGEIYRENNHIALDCGAVYGGKLGCICLNTGEEYYT